MAFARASKILASAKRSKLELFDSSLFRDFEIRESIITPNSEKLVFELLVKNEFCNLHGSLHGGAMCTIVDILTTIHSWASDPQERIAKSVDLSVSFYNAVQPNDLLKVETEVTGLNLQFAFTRAHLIVGNKLIGKGTQTLYFLDQHLSRFIKI